MPSKIEGNRLLNKSPIRKLDKEPRASGFFCFMGYFKRKVIISYAETRAD
jgi:hypothetical protein